MDLPAPLLRHLAAVAPGTTVVDLACGDGALAEALARLGLDVWASADAAGAVSAARRRLAFLPDADARISFARPDALGFPDAFAAWAVVSGVASGALPAVLAEAARVLAPGGWVWVEAAPEEAPAIASAADRAGLVEAVPRADDPARGAVQALYRRPGGIG